MDVIGARQNESKYVNFINKILVLSLLGYKVLVIHPGRSRGLLYKHRHNRINNFLSKLPFGTLWFFGATKAPPPPFG